MAPPNMLGFRSASFLEHSFRLSLTFKGFHALLEMIIGTLLLGVNPLAINRFVMTLVNPELSEDSGDFIATHILRASQQFAADGKHFPSLYLLSHGLVKIVLVAALFRNKLWAYPMMIVTLSTFVFHQTYRFVLNHSLVMIFLSLFDVVVIVLTWLEYVKQRLIATNLITGAID